MSGISAGCGCNSRNRSYTDCRNARKEGHVSAGASRRLTCPRRRSLRVNEIRRIVASDLKQTSGGPDGPAPLEPLVRIRDITTARDLRKPPSRLECGSHGDPSALEYPHFGSRDANLFVCLKEIAVTKIFLMATSVAIVLLVFLFAAHAHDLSRPELDRWFEVSGVARGHAVPPPTARRSPRPTGT